MLRWVLMLSVLALPLAVQAQERPSKGGDERLDALEMKLQALLKEIQALKSEKGAKAAPTEERKALAGKLAEAQKEREKALTEAARAREKALAEAHKERDKAHAEARKALAEKKVEGEKKKADGDKKGDGEKKTVRGFKIGDDGKAIEIELKLEDLKDLEKLKKLGTLHLDKLKDMDHLKKLGEDQLKHLKIELGELEKKGLKLDTKDIEKLKDAQLKLAGKAKELAGIELKLQKDGKPAVVEGAPGKTVRVEEVKPANVAGGSYRYTTGSGDGGTVHLTRVTYSLSGDQAKALADFLKAFAKASVLETSIDGNKLVVTTTPDVQSTIGQVVGLMSGKSTGAVRTLTAPATPASPKTLSIPVAPKVIVNPKAPSSPEAPKAPAKPEKPSKPKKPVKDDDKDDDDK